MKDATRRRVRRAAELKSTHAIAYADAFAVATAIEFNAVLVTGDPEIELLEGEPNLRVEWLRKILTTRSTLVITSSGTSRSRLPRS